MRRNAYTPLVYVDEGGEVFSSTNPYPKRQRQRFVRFSRGAAEPGTSYGSLRVQVGLIRDKHFDPKNLPGPITDSEGVYRLVSRALRDDPQESFLVLLLTARNYVTGIYEAHRGSLTGVEVHPADVLRPVLVAGVPSFIVVHNHPSGDAEPSENDATLTRRLSEAAKLVGVSLLDHVIVGADGFTSFADRGML